jgi:hypothetical protein
MKLRVKLVKFLSSLMHAPSDDKPGSETFVFLFKIIVLKKNSAILRRGTLQKLKNKMNPQKDPPQTAP